MTTTTTTGNEAAAVVDGLHSRRGVEYLAAAAGLSPDQIGAAVVFGAEMGFSRLTGFIKSSNGRGYYMVTEETCTCPSFTYRGGPCKHQRKLAAILRARAGPSLPAGVVPLSSEALEARRRRIEERNAARVVSPRVEEVRGRGFNLPPDDDFPEVLARAPL